MTLHPNHARRPAMTPATTRPVPAVLRRCACGSGPGGACAACRQKRLARQSQANGGHETMREPAAGSAAPAIVGDVLRGTGQPLDARVRLDMERRLGHDFRHVRVHTGEHAGKSARAVAARAYAVGSHVVFAPGHFAPATAEGRRLLAHELTHVAQQETGRDAAGGARIVIGPANDAIEREADAASGASEQAAGTRPARTTHQRSPGPIRRCVLRRAPAPTGIEIAAAKPFGHADLTSEENKKKRRTLLGSTTLMRVTPKGDYKGHCVKEFLTEVANTCPPRFAELLPKGFCRGNKCLEIGGHGTAGDPETRNTVTDGPDTFIDLHRTRGDKSLLEGTGKKACSIVCHQLYKFDRKDELGAFYIIRNFRASSFTPKGSKDALHITTGDIRKLPAPRKAPTEAEFAKKEAPGLKKKGELLEAPSAGESEKPGKEP